MKNALHNPGSVVCCWHRARNPRQQRHSHPLASFLAPKRGKTTGRSRCDRKATGAAVDAFLAPALHSTRNGVKGISQQEFPMRNQAFTGNKENTDLAHLAHLEATGEIDPCETATNLRTSPMFRSLVSSVEHSLGVTIKDDFCLRLLAARMYLAARAIGEV